MTCLLFSATYCIVIFALMLLSLLETILIMYLMQLDSQDLQLKAEIHNCKAGKNHIMHCILQNYFLNI